MIDAAAQSEESFEASGDIGLNLLRRHSRIKGRDYHNGNVDVGEQINRHAPDSHDADDPDHHAKHDDEEWIFDSESRHRLLCASIRLFGVENAHAWVDRLPVLVRAQIGDDDAVAFIDSGDDFY